MVFDIGAILRDGILAFYIFLHNIPQLSAGVSSFREECPEILAIQLAGSSEIQERMMLLLKEGGAGWWLPLIIRNPAPPTVATC